jgi:hypothetical protein
MLSGSIKRSTRGSVSGSARAFAWHAWGSLVRVSRTGRNLFLDGGNLRLRFGNRGFQVFQRQFQLRGVELF